MYICKFSVLFLSSGIGVFKRVILGGPVGGGSTENKKPTKQGAGWGKLNGKQKISYYILYSLYTMYYLAILKTTHLYRV